MKSKIVVMLTHNDQTVENALEVFESCKALPIDFWGFKDVGIPLPKMKELHDAMKSAGKKTFLEVVTYQEEECLAGAKLAADFGFDFLMGTLPYPSVIEYLKGKPLKYLPFVGEVSGSPSVLNGSAADMAAQANDLAAKGVYGVDILAYRHARLDPEALSREFVAEAKLEVCIAGSISSFARIDAVNSINPWSFTMGSALFTKNFVKDGSFCDNLKAVADYMASI